MESIKVDNLNNLSNIITKNLPNVFYELTCEISKPHKSGKHIYLGLKDDNNFMNGIIWDSNINLNDGDKIKIKGKLNFYKKRGNLSLIIQELELCEDKGKLFKQYKEIQNYCHKHGYFDMDHKLKLPNLIRKILVLTSLNDGAAAFKDFKYGIEKNKLILNISSMNVAVQGENCPKDIIDVLNNVPTINDFDLIIIMRGGGSFEDLFGFSNLDLIKSVYKCNTPILSAIGHNIDNPLLDLVADIYTPTPSFAADFIYNTNMHYFNDIKNISKKFQSILQKDLMKLFEELVEKELILEKQKNIIETYSVIYYNNILKDINNNLLKLEKISIKPDHINVYNNDNILLKNEEDFKQLLERNQPFTFNWGSSIINVSSYKVL